MKRARDDANEKNHVRQIRFPIKSPPCRVYSSSMPGLTQPWWTNGPGAEMDPLVRRLTHGDPSAFAELYDACADRVHHYLVVRLGSRADADNAFKRPSSAWLGRERVWLRSRIWRPTCSPPRVTRPSDSSSDPHARADYEPPCPRNRYSTRPGDAVYAIETAEWVTTSLARLDPELREIVELKIYAGLTLREISEVTGLPQGTVATPLSVST